MKNQIKPLSMKEISTLKRPLDKYEKRTIDKALDKKKAMFKKGAKEFEDKHPTNHYLRSLKDKPEGYTL